MANIITSIRIICALALIFCPAFNIPFYIFYAIGGISDVLDGIIARRIKTETEFGAKYDTVADIIFTIIVFVKIIFAVNLPIWLYIWAGLIATIKIISFLCGFIKFRQFISEHTVMNKICGILLFLIPFYIGFLPNKTITILLFITCVAATVAATEEGYYIYKGKEIN